MFDQQTENFAKVSNRGITTISSTMKTILNVYKIK